METIAIPVNLKVVRAEVSVAVELESVGYSGAIRGEEAATAGPQALTYSAAASTSA